MKSIKDLKRFSKDWWKNLFFYYKWHALIGLVALVLIVGTVVRTVTRVEPDLYVLFSGDYALLEEERTLLKDRMAQAISDVNGDEKIAVELIEIPLKLDSEHVDETTAASNLQMQTQFVTGEQHIYVLDRELYNLYYGQGMLDPDTLYVETATSPLFQGTSLAERDAVMVTRVKRHDYESDFTSSQQLIDVWGNVQTTGEEAK